MKKTISFICLSLLITGCATPAAPPQSKQADCHKQAADRLTLYNKPGASSISENEKGNALSALYDECMRERQKYYTHEVDTTHAKTTAQIPPLDTSILPAPGITAGGKPAETSSASAAKATSDLENIVGRTD